jgi:hypothetical protein
MIKKRAMNSEPSIGIKKTGFNSAHTKIGGASPFQNLTFLKKVSADPLGISPRTTLENMRGMRH